MKICFDKITDPLNDTMLGDLSVTLSILEKADRQNEYCQTWQMTEKSLISNDPTVFFLKFQQDVGQLNDWFLFSFICLNFLAEGWLLGVQELISNHSKTKFSNCVKLSSKTNQTQEILYQSQPSSWLHNPQWKWSNVCKKRSVCLIDYLECGAVE